jgi:hypothetical protein
MRTIYSPSTTGEDSVEACEQALEPAFMQLIDRARQAGWCSEDVVDALNRLARVAAEQDRRQNRRYA